MRSPTIVGVTVSLLAAQTSAATVQKSGLAVPAKYAAQRDVVKKIFTDSFAAYQKFAFGHDEVNPVSGTATDDRNGWGASVVDAMSTMLIMNLPDLYQVALNHTSQIDFSRTKVSGTVSVFETTIRYVGGMLSAYELNGKKDAVLLQKAQQLANKLAFAWVGSNPIPYGHIDFGSNKPNVDITNIAEAGTLVLEWNKLSQYTGNQTYVQLAEKAMRAIASRTDTLLPGLAGQNVHPESGEFANKYVTWSGGSDSYFEYLIKYARLTNNASPLWVQTWKTAVDSSLKSLAKRTTVGEWLMMGELDANRNYHRSSSHLACFHGGNFIFGGRLLGNDSIVRAGLRLVDSCTNTYASTASGIGPEGFSFVTSDGNDGPSSGQTAFNNVHGYYITNGFYDLRPEVMESNFYAWRATGRVQYLDNAVNFIERINSLLRVASSGGYAVWNDVNNANAGVGDRTESFWFAETLKYLYLTFDDPAHISLDAWTFNTEAHPFAAPAELPSYNV